MAEILDQRQDTAGTEQHRLLSLYPPPDFVKQASAEQRGLSTDLLEPHLYAADTLGLYPCHTKAAVWLSTLFWLDKQAQVPARLRPAIEERLRTTAAYFGIERDVQALQQKFAEDQTVDLNTLPDSDFAIVWQGPGKVKNRHWPLRNGEEVKLAAEQLRTYRDQFTFEDRFRMADRLLSKAAEYGAGLPNDLLESLQQMAGHGSAATPAVVAALQTRSRWIRSKFPELSGKMAALAETLETRGDLARDADLRFKVACVLDSADRETGLAREYARGELRRPEEVVYAVNYKTAQAYLADLVELPGGQIYTTAALQKLAVADVRDWLGDEVADAVSTAGLYIEPQKLAACLAQQPADQVRRFDQLLEVSGVQPVQYRKEATQLPRLTREKLQALAAEYQPLDV